MSTNNLKAALEALGAMAGFGVGGWLSFYYFEYLVLILLVGVSLAFLLMVFTRLYEAFGGDFSWWYDFKEWLDSTGKKG